MAKRIRTRRELKELNNKIAEIIYLVITGIIFTSGLVMGIMGGLIETISGNFKASTLYFLIQAQDSFFAWINSWWKGFPLKSFTSLGLLLIFIGVIILLIVLLLFSKKSDILLKKEKARKLRESNIKKFEARLESTQNNNQIS